MWQLNPLRKLHSVSLEMREYVDARGDLVISAEGRIFALSRTAYTNDLLNLIWIEPLTGAAQLIGATGFKNIRGLAFGPGETLYGVASDSPSTGPAILVRIDTSTGKASEVARITGIPEVLSIIGLCSFQVGAPSP